MADRQLRSRIGLRIPKGESGPDTESSDYCAMKDYWALVRHLIDGAEAMRCAGRCYLPQFPAETDKNYEYRRKNAKYTNIYRDIIESLSAKPFTKEVGLADGASASIKKLSEDIDAQGNHLHVFAENIFFNGINDGVTWILVDHTKVPQGATLADERSLGARPYWVHIPASRLLAVYSDMVNGEETIVHARILECTKERNGFDEVETMRVRVLDRARLPGIPGSPAQYGPATYTLYEFKDEDKNDKESGAWEIVDEGAISIGVIPLVPFLTGRRKGGSWVLHPPMKDAAFLQVEHYQQDTNLKWLKELTCVPMLAGNGVTPELDDSGNPKMVPISPGTVLYAPPSPDGTIGSWSFIEPNANSLQFLANDLDTTAKELRELGRQPLTANAGNLTVITTAFAAQKGNSAIQAWTYSLKDALERAFALTAKWLGETAEPEIKIDTDFDLNLDDQTAPGNLLAMRQNGDISQETLWSEMKRRKVLSDEFDADKEKELLMEETPDPDTLDDMAASLTGPGENPPRDQPDMREAA